MPNKLVHELVQSFAKQSLDDVVDALAAYVTSPEGWGDSLSDAMKLAKSESERRLLIQAFVRASMVGLSHAVQAFCAHDDSIELRLEKDGITAIVDGAVPLFQLYEEAVEQIGVPSADRVLTACQRWLELRRDKR